jgi:cysteine-rich secretory family protein
VVSVPCFAQRGSPDPEQVAELAVRLTNEFRGTESRKGVVVNARLLGAARYFAGYMATSGKFSHEADGSDPAARAKKYGYDYCIASENIAYRYSSTGFATRELAQGFVEGWKNSPGHRKNMLDPDVTETAVAVVRGEPGRYYAVQMFGRPASQAVKFSVANQSSAAIRYRLGGTAFSLAPRQTRTHQGCRSGELKFDWPGTQRETTIRTKDGDRFAVVRSNAGGFSLRSE